MFVVSKNASHRVRYPYVLKTSLFKLISGDNRGIDEAAKMFSNAAFLQDLCVCNYSDSFAISPAWPVDYREAPLQHWLPEPLFVKFLAC